MKSLYRLRLLTNDTCNGDELDAYESLAEAINKGCLELFLEDNPEVCGFVIWQSYRDGSPERLRAMVNAKLDTYDPDTPKATAIVLDCQTGQATEHRVRYRCTTGGVYLSTDIDPLWCDPVAQPADVLDGLEFDTACVDE